MHISTILQTGENKQISSSYVDTNNEDWAGWFGWQPGIDEVKYQITSFGKLFTGFQYFRQAQQWK